MTFNRSVFAVDSVKGPRGNLAIGAAAWNGPAITEQVVVANANPFRVNGSALNQLRVNENALDPVGGFDWEMREFKLNAPTKHLEMVTVKQTPAASMRFSHHFGDYVNSHAASITAGTHQVPLQYPVGNPFRGGSDIFGFSTLWDRQGVPDAIVDREARHQFALKTCSGCHRRETDTMFTHVAPAAFGAPVLISGFLTGESVPDAADAVPVRNFDDLQRRATDLDALLATPCVIMVRDAPLRFVH